MGERLVKLKEVRIPAPGFGYIAGESPDGIVTLDNAPGRAAVDLLVRSNRDWLRRTVSKDDGTYQFSGVPLANIYDVIGQDLLGKFGDVIVSRVAAYAAPKVSTAALSFQVGMPPNTTMESQYGTAPFVWTAVGLPPGLILLADGVFDPQGLPTTAGTYQATITVEDAHGSASSRDYAIVVTS